MHGADSLLFLIVIIIAARTGGEIAERLHQPAVFGEILAGVLIGLIPVIHPAVDNEAIKFIAEIGVILLLFEVGLDSEFGDFLKVGLPAGLVAIIGVIAPLAAGFGVAVLLRYAAGMRFTNEEALFLGATLTATSVGITARVLKDLRQQQRKEAKIIIGAAVVDDVLGLLVLSIVLGIAAPTLARAGSPALTIALAIVFLVVAIVVGLKSAPFFIGLTGRMKGRGILTVAAFLFCLVLAYIGALVGLAPIVGAFAAGLVLASTEDRIRITERIQPVADIFVPVFFALVGMQVDLKLLNPVDPRNWPILGLAGALLLVAVPTKLLAGLGAVGQRVDKLAIGIGMVPRGEVGLIFASIGLANGILNHSVYNAIIIVVLVTTLITPPWLRHRLSRRSA